VWSVEVGQEAAAGPAHCRLEPNDDVLLCPLKQISSHPERVAQAHVLLAAYTSFALRPLDGSDPISVQEHWLVLLLCYTADSQLRLLVVYSIDLSTGLSSMQITQTSISTLIDLAESLVAAVGSSWRYRCVQWRTWA
jgi:hypothetical protein